MAVSFCSRGWHESFGIMVSVVVGFLNISKVNSPHAIKRHTSTPQKFFNLRKFYHRCDLLYTNTVIPRLTKIIRFGITFVSRNLR